MKNGSRIVFAVIFMLAATVVFAQRIIVTFPGSGDVLRPGQSFTVTWTTSGEMDDRVRIRLWKGSGGAARRVHDFTDDTANDGEHPCTLPAVITAADDYYIRVITVDEAVYDDGSMFSISGASITVSSPMETGAYMVRGTTPIPIAWTCSGLSGDVRIELERWDGAGTHTIRSSHPCDGSPLSYPVPDGVAAGTYRVKISQGSIVGYSGRIGILAYVPPSLTLRQPNGGEVLTHGGMYTIEWDAHNLDGNLRIDLLKGGILYKIIAESHIVNAGFFTWRNILTSVRSKVVSGTNFRIHIYTHDRRFSDRSDADFTIQPRPGIWLFKPTAVDVWDEDSAQEIRWNAQGLEGRTVSIILRFTSGSPLNIRTIAEGVPAMDKRYAWTVMDLEAGPYNLRPGTYPDAVITVRTEGAGVTCADSSKEFTIRKR
ncbi:MAG: hypothetical protein JXO51_01940 [Candidatus Aminicenantes bacterium]|nr:hypothetical protein [Candidatus Aminicenantes bacterium]